MNEQLVEAKQHFVEGISRISNFWGFPKAMGAIFAALYLSPETLTLDQLVSQVGVSKGAVSTNIRNLERLGMVHKKLVVGDRKDYYSAETDFWKIVKGILREREKNEFDKALRSVGESLELAANSPAGDTDLQLQAFYRERMTALKQFFDNLDNLVATLLAIDDIKNSVLKGLFNRDT
jgi:DNA-binding transcriptional regulator GbsR (MarR family)